MEVYDKCPKCGSFKMKSYKFDTGYSEGTVEKCLDCGFDSTIEAKGKGFKNLESDGQPS